MVVHVAPDPMAAVSMVAHQEGLAVASVEDFVVVKSWC